MTSIFDSFIPNLTRRRDRRVKIRMDLANCNFCSHSYLHLFLFIYLFLLIVLTEYMYLLIGILHT